MDIEVSVRNAIARVIPRNVDVINQANGEPINSLNVNQNEIQQNGFVDIEQKNSKKASKEFKKHQM
jgi:hypothetical protein